MQTIQYKSGYYIHVQTFGNKEELEVIYSPTGYGYKWRKTGIKSMHAAKLAISKHIKERVKQEILQAMAKAFFASAWADQAEDTGNSSILSGAEIMDIMPKEIDKSAIHAANTLCMEMERHYGRPINEIFDILCKHTEGEGDIDHTPENFGHYAAMQAMGHGVGLYDAFGKKSDAVKVPYTEFGAYSLEKDYFANNEE
jgi:hypothetical protein